MVSMPTETQIILGIPNIVDLLHDAYQQGFQDGGSDRCFDGEVVGFNRWLKDKMKEKE